MKGWKDESIDAASKKAKTPGERERKDLSLSVQEINIPGFVGVSKFLLSEVVKYSALEIIIKG